MLGFQKIKENSGYSNIRIRYVAYLYPIGIGHRFAAL